MIAGPELKFKKDDSVQHIQGGPFMLVDEVKFTSLKDPSRVNCPWCSNVWGRTQRGTFSQEDLKY
jgi:uncharacterized protein YodC (DUF2158 family)